MSLTLPYWCSETFSTDGKTSSWTPVSQRDHELLEQAIETQQKLAYIETKRTSANITERTLRGCYDFTASSAPVPDRRIIRASWFYLDSSVPVPLSEEAGQRIEEWFNTIKDGQPTADAPFTAELDVDVVLNNERGAAAVTYRIQAIKEVIRERRGTQGQRLVPEEVAPKASSRLKIDGFTIKMYPKASLLKLGSLTLQRGVCPPPVTAEETWARLPEEDHLVLVVHGIGQYYFAGTDDSFSSCIDKLRINLMEQRCALDAEDATYARDKANPSSSTPGAGAGSEAAKQQDGNTEDNPNGHKRIECFGVEWFNELHDDSSIGMHAALDKVTLPSVPSVRKLAHNVAMDVMLYLMPEFRQKILRLVVEKINLMYHQFSELNPSFVENGGMCSIVGHSLGTVIVYDVLAMQNHHDLPPHLKLAFDPTAYFSLGSPLGMFLTLRNTAARVHNLEVAATGSGQGAGVGAPLDDDILNAAYSFPTCKQFFNVFNKNDPVAYRIEPMTDATLQDREPVIVPHYDGGLRAQYLLKSVASTITQTWRSFASPSGWFKSATSTTTSSSTTLAVSSNNLSVEDVDPKVVDGGDGRTSEGGSELRVLQREAASLRRQKILPADDRIPHVLLNGGRRFDFLLQESVVEAANEFISSLTSHTSYFEQKDVARFIAAMLI